MLYEERFGERLPDPLKRSVYQTKVAPANLQEHLLLNAEMFPDASDVADEIERYCDAKEEHEQAMGVPSAWFIGAVEGKPRGKAKDKDKGKKGETGKGKDSKSKKDERGNSWTQASPHTYHSHMHSPGRVANIWAGV